MSGVILYSFFKFFKPKTTFVEDSEELKKKNKQICLDKLKDFLLENQKKIKNINCCLKKAIKEKKFKLVEYLLDAVDKLINTYEEKIEYCALNSDLDLLNCLLRNKSVYRLDFKKFLRISAKVDDLDIFKFLIDEKNIDCDFDKMLLLSVKCKSYNISMYIIKQKLKKKRNSI